MMAAFARKRAQDKDIADATAAVTQFNARAKAELGTVAWPTIGAALISKHHWAHNLDRPPARAMTAELERQKRGWPAYG